MSTLPVTLNVVGCGKLGTTLPRLLRDAGVVQIGGLCSRTRGRAETARAFIGACIVVDDATQLPAAGLWLRAVSDDAIADSAHQLAAQRDDWRDVTVFHTSGLHDAGLLAPLAARGARTASLHPAHSFADPQQSLLTFAGSCCALEGEPAAKEQLAALLSALQVRILNIDAASKPLYHAATAMASNYLVSLMASSLALLEQAGIEDTDARALLAPLAGQTAANVFARGAVAALTGPIARGDSKTVAHHLAAIAGAQPDLLELYRTLGRATLALADSGQMLTAADAEKIASLLHPSDS